MRLLRSRHALRDEPNDQTMSSVHSAHHAERDGYVKARQRSGSRLVVDHIDHLSQAADFLAVEGERDAGERQQVVLVRF